MLGAAADLFGSPVLPSRLGCCWFCAAAAIVHVRSCSTTPLHAEYVHSGEPLRWTLLKKSPAFVRVRGILPPANRGSQDLAPRRLHRLQRNAARLLRNASVVRRRVYWLLAGGVYLEATFTTPSRHSQHKETSTKVFPAT